MKDNIGIGGLAAAMREHVSKGKNMDGKKKKKKHYRRDEPMEHESPFRKKRMMEED